LNSFRITSGTVVGREHARLCRNNQDGLGIAVEGSIVAVVTDGCSEGRASEVGAKLAASWLAARGPHYVQAAELDPSRFVPSLADGLIRFLEPIAREISGRDIDPALVQEHFLFTFLMVVISEARTTVFGAGDGVFAVNGVRIDLESKDNAPDYLGYRLVGRSVEPVIHFDGPTLEVQSLIVATDGARELDLEELLEPKFLDNRSLLHRRLNALGAVKGKLFDDTTVVLVRRSPCE
jgi:hypothetical protein